jgi:hypothetical protein
MVCTSSSSTAAMSIGFGYPSRPPKTRRLPLSSPWTKLRIFALQLPFGFIDT